MYQLTEKFLKLIGVARRVETHAPRRGRGPCDHIVVLDGTMSSLDEGCETNAGLIYKLLAAQPGRSQQLVYYAGGVQFRRWRDIIDVAQGRGINRQITGAYGWLASHYRPGDRIFLFGYSRGGFAVRSLAGMIDQLGLLTADAATERNIRLAFRYYQTKETRPAEEVFVRRFCHEAAEVQMIGVFDTVKALGLRLPFLWVLTEAQHDFHSHRLGAAVRHGFQALALDETRSVYEPVLWECPPDFRGPCRTGLVSRHAWRCRRPAWRQRQFPPAVQHPAGLDAGKGRGDGPCPARGLAGSVPHRCGRAVGRDLVGMGQAVLVPRAARGGP